MLFIPILEKRDYECHVIVMKHPGKLAAYYPSSEADLERLGRVEKYYNNNH